MNRRISMTIDIEILRRLNRYVDEFALGTERGNRSLYISNLIKKHVPELPP